MDAEDKLTRARIQLQKTNPFFAFLLLHSDVQEDPGTLGQKVPTMGVDARGNLYYNRSWVENLSERETEGVLCHEIMHVALEHLYRSQKMKANPKIHNVASDLVVNDILMESGFQLPKEGCIPRNHEFKHPQFTVSHIDDKCVEEIYDEIMSQIPEQDCPGQCSGGDSGDGEGSESGDGNNPCDGCPNADSCAGGADSMDTHIMSESGEGSEQQRKEQREWKKRVSEAGHYAKMRGELPAGLERRIGELFESKLNWKKMLNHYITSAIPHDYTWSRPSMKSIVNGLYLPATKKNEQLEVVVAIDTSGSIGQEELTEFLSEMVGIAKTYSQVKMRVIECDADIQYDRLVENGNIKKILETGVHGGGGTSHEPVYQYIAEKYKDTKILINFTDGYTYFPEQQKWKFDSIWVLTKQSCPEDNIPFGKVVKIK